ncbi:lipopolysaccharide biosynthesis protein [Collinsella sp. HCP28S3_E5]|uniref:lipopolysaccharide biosynthesis protein n=1 Tax=Collinsella sp. HCP28S3_E5 TaxID=3438922 RepID=UPI003F8BDEB7
MRKVFKDIALAFLSQGISTLSSVLLALFLPKILGVKEYGYWQLLLFYMGYAGFLHFGLNDGLYLEKGGQARNVIDKQSVFSQFVVGLLFQVIIAGGIFLAALTVPFEQGRTHVLIVFSLTFPLTNASSFLGLMFQAMNETPLYSLSNVAATVTLFITFISLMFTHQTAVEPYLIAYLLSELVRFAYCILHANDFMHAGLRSAVDSIHLSIHSVRIGIKLMISNIMSQLILGCVRFFIDASWGIEVFSIVSFSISIASLFLTFLSQASMVFFPNLKQASEKTLRKLFIIMRDSLDLLTPLVLFLYGPVIVILNAWIPQYAKSLELFSILFPICIFDGKMDIVGTTFFKVLRKEKLLLKINLVAFISSVLMSICGTYILHSVEITLVGVLMILGLRSTYSEFKIASLLCEKSTRLGAADLLLSAFFVAIAQICNPFTVSLIFIAVYCIFLSFNKDRLKSLFGEIRALEKNI